MVVVGVEEAGNGRKRRRKIKKRLLVKEKVEVRSFEDGFLGSWHCGTVIACNKGVRHVMYDHLLLNDGSDFLVDVVSVSAVLDNIDSSTGNSYSRGYIRPVPPVIDYGKWGLPYGLCVDVYYQDAWWEGVIFDHEDGLEERRIFFPDLGDELKVGMETMRITQDWDEATGNWQRRGTWLFLELIDQCEQECYLAVSVKQIWYEVRSKKGFLKIGDWTSAMNDLWKELVMEVIDENLDITLKEMLRNLEIPSNVAIELPAGNVNVTENPPINLVDSDDNVTNSVKCDLAFDNASNQENAFVSCGLIMEEVGLDKELLDSGPSSATIHLTQERSQMDVDVYVETSNNLGSSCHDGAFPLLPKASSTSISSNAERSSGACSIPHQQVPIIKHKNVNEQLKCSGIRNFYTWQSLNSATLPDAALCPGAVIEYARLDRKNPKSILIKDVRRHLLYLGWKFECRQDKYVLRYTSPDGKCFYSLHQVCKHLAKPSAEILPSISHNETRVSYETCDEIYSSQVLEQTEKSPSPEHRFQIALGGSDVVFEEPEVCHKSVIGYNNLNKLDNNGVKNMAEMRSRARRHLSSLGWDLLVSGKGKKQRWFYTSPHGKTYGSLSMALKVCVDEKGVHGSTDSACRPVESIYLIRETEGQFDRNEFSSAPRNVDVQECLVPSNSIKTFYGESPGMTPSKDLMEFSNSKFQGIGNLSNKANVFDLSSHLLQKQHKLNGKELESGIHSIGKKYMRRMRSLGAVKQKLNRRKVSVNINKSADDMECSKSTRMLRSSKRVHEVVTPSPSHHNPRTVLSWLIDNNVVLPRAKVYYCSRKGLRAMAEGRVSRDGIKCCCCQKVFTLNGFEIHAGNTSSRSAASIYLEDGRSLLDCQILCNKKTRNFKREAFDCRNGGCPKGENDYICSICHFGGILILCDQCPSSFHQSCLGLKDIPEGDWFCQSCCCGICGQNKLSEGSNIIDDPFLTCHQCEHKYHVKCLRSKGIPHFGSYLKAYWFCNKNCGEIYWGLQRLLGKSIPVHGDNLTWSLLKAANSDTHFLNPPDVETLTENHSKLNVALSVMHECFEPVKEPHTRRDLVEDVIFSRRSELKRLNFQGFYTVLLERNDELVSVAAIRVYGEKVAEIPLVGTRFQYRRLGMCRILMNELEKRLRELGVQRLVLPAVSSVLNTWTNSFGFSKMTESERSEFLDYTFLDFQETTMCQKFLQKNTGVPRSVTGKSKPLDDVSKTSNSTNIDGSSAITEVHHQTAHTAESRIIDQAQLDSAGNNSNNIPSPEAAMVKSASCLQSNMSHTQSFHVCSADGFKNFECLHRTADDYLKCYKRRKKVISC